MSDEYDRHNLKWGETDHLNEVFKTSEINTMLVAAWLQTEGASDSA